MYNVTLNIVMHIQNNFSNGEIILLNKNKNGDRSYSYDYAGVTVGSVTISRLRWIRNKL